MEHPRPVAQGVGFGLILSSSEVEATSQGSSAIASTLLVVVAVLFFVMALRQLLSEDDPDAAPPKWMQATASMAPGKAFCSVPVCWRSAPSSGCSP